MLDSDIYDRSFMRNLTLSFILIKVCREVTFMGVHSPTCICLESEDYTEVYNDLRETVSLVKVGRKCPGQGSFAHLTGGYDAGYYG